MVLLAAVEENLEKFGMEVPVEVLKVEVIVVVVLVVDVVASLKFDIIERLTKNTSIFESGRRVVVVDVVLVKFNPGKIGVPKQYPGIKRRPNREVRGMLAQDAKQGLK